MKNLLSKKIKHRNDQNFEIADLEIDEKSAEKAVRSLKIEGALYILIIIFTLPTIIIPIILVLLAILRGQTLHKRNTELAKIRNKLSYLRKSE